MLPTAPDKPKGAPGSPRPAARNSKSGPAGVSSGSASLASSLKPKPLPRHVEIAITALNREEQLFRSTIEMQCSVAEWEVQSQISEEREARVARCVARTERWCERHSQVAQDHTQTLSQLVAAAKDTRQDSIASRERIEKFFAYLESTERKENEALRVEHAALSSTVSRQNTEMEFLRAEVHALRDQLNRRILRNAEESAFLRRMVMDEIGTSKIAIDQLRKSLHDHIDDCVMSFHKPSYTTALQSLKDHVDEVKKKVNAQSDTLHNVIDEIATRDRFFNLEGDGSTMHSNLPALYRRELQHLTKDQLLNVLDVVSYEEGVVDAVGKALKARKLAQHGDTTDTTRGFTGDLLLQ